MKLALYKYAIIIIIIIIILMFSHCDSSTHWPLGNLNESLDM